MKRLAVLLVVAACFAPIMKWPERGALVRAVNPAPHPLQLLVEDGRGRLLSKGMIGAYGDRCFRWPWVDERGRILVALGADTIMSDWWYPWSYDRWTWTVGDSVPTAGKAC